jgi:hypothetical protein
MLITSFGSEHGDQICSFLFEPIQGEPRVCIVALYVCNYYPHNYIAFLLDCTEIFNVLTPDVKFIGIAINTDVTRLMLQVSHLRSTGSTNFGCSFPSFVLGPCCLSSHYLITLLFEIGCSMVCLTCHEQKC